MHPLEKETLDVIREHALLLPGERVVAGVSAGADSLALLQVLAALAPGLGVEVVAVYVDHGLRPAETGAEAELVRAAGARLGVAVEVVAVAVQEQARREKLSLEDAARQARYGVFHQLARKYGAAKIAVAHTADDQAEEVLLRLIRGCGRKGLAGMAPWREGGVIRPFLTVAKERLLDYLADRHLAFLEDSSNRERQFLRNRIRLDLLPYLEESFNPRVRQTLRQTAAILGEEEELLAAMAATAAEAIVRIPGPGEVVLDRERLLAAPLALQRRVVEIAFWQLGHPPGFRPIAQLLRLAAGGGGAARLHFSGGLRVRRQGPEIFFSYPRGRVRLRGELALPPAIAYERLLPGPGSYLCPELGIRLELAELGRAELAETGFTPGVEYLAAEQLSYPLLLRTIRPGDRFQPLGGPGRKKVADFLSDLKIPPSRRLLQPVLLAGEEIVALPGRRVAERVRVQDGSRRVLRLECVLSALLG